MRLLSKKNVDSVGDKGQHEEKAVMGNEYSIPDFAFGFNSSL